MNSDEELQKHFRNFFRGLRRGDSVAHLSTKELVSNCEEHLTELELVLEDTDSERRTRWMRIRLERVIVHTIQLAMFIDPLKSFEDFVEEILTMNLQDKAHDYESDQVSFVDYWPNGCRDLWVLPWGKCLRLKSLMSSMSTPKCESILDNCLDLASYSAWLWSLYLYKHYTEE